MSRVLVDSPAGKKGRYDPSPSKGFVQVGDVTDIDCPDRTCDGKLINRQSSNGARFVTCTRGSKVDEKCNFSGNILFKDTRKISSTQDEAERLQRLCVSCLGEVHGAVSIGKPTGETTQKGGKGELFSFSSRVTLFRARASVLLGLFSTDCFQTFCAIASTHS